jgi:hypothetical protein
VFYQCVTQIVRRVREGRCEGRKPLRLGRKLSLWRRKDNYLPSADAGVAYREVSRELAGNGFLNERGKPYKPRGAEPAS